MVLIQDRSVAMPTAPSWRRVSGRYFRPQFSSQFPPAVFTRCFHPLFAPTVFTHCFHLLFSPTVYTYCFHPLFSPTVFNHCFTPLYPPTVSRFRPPFSRAVFAHCIYYTSDVYDNLNRFRVIEDHHKCFVIITASAERSNSYIALTI